MRALVPLLLLALAAASGACRSAQPATAGSARDRAELEALVHAQEAAWNRGDLAAFMQLGYWRSDDLTFFSGGEVSRGFEPMLARYRAKYEAPGAERGDLRFSALEVVPLAEGVALVRGRWDLDFRDRPDVGGLYSLVVRRLSEGWRIVHDHTSVDG